MEAVGTEETAQNENDLPEQVVFVAYGGKSRCIHFQFIDGVAVITVIFAEKSHIAGFPGGKDDLVDAAVAVVLRLHPGPVAAVGRQINLVLPGVIGMPVDHHAIHLVPLRQIDHQPFAAVIPGPPAS